MNFRDPNKYRVDSPQTYRPCFSTEAFNKSILSVKDPAAERIDEKSMIDSDLQQKVTVHKFSSTYFNSVEITESISIKDSALKLKEITTKLADPRLSKKDRNKLEVSKEEFLGLMEFCDFHAFTREDRTLFLQLMADITERFINRKKSIIEKWADYIAMVEQFIFYIKLDTVSKLFWVEIPQARNILKSFKRRLATINSVSIGTPKFKTKNGKDIEFSFLDAAKTADLECFIVSPTFIFFLCSQVKVGWIPNGAFWNHNPRANPNFANIREYLSQRYNITKTKDGKNLTHDEWMQTKIIQFEEVFDTKIDDKNYKKTFVYPLFDCLNLLASLIPFEWKVRADTQPLRDYFGIDANGYYIQCTDDSRAKVRISADTIRNSDIYIAVRFKGLEAAGWGNTEKTLLVRKLNTEKERIKRKTKCLKTLQT